MKRIRLLLLLIILLLATNSVKAMQIKSIELKEKSEGVVVKTEPTIDGLNVNLDIKFDVAEDFIKYNLVVLNDQEEEYVFTEDIIKSKDDSYFAYTYETDKTTLKSGETANISITIKYEGAPAELFTADNPTFVETNNVSFSLVDANPVEEIANPQTLDKSIVYYSILGLSLIGVGVTIYLFRKTGKKQYLLVMVGLLIANVSGIYALNNITITFNTKFEVADPNEFCVAVIEAPLQKSGEEEEDYVEEEAQLQQILETKCFKYTEEQKIEEWVNEKYGECMIFPGLEVPIYNPNFPLPAASPFETLVGRIAIVNPELPPICEEFFNYFINGGLFIERDKINDGKFNMDDTIYPEHYDSELDDWILKEEFKTIRNKKYGYYISVRIIEDEPIFDDDNVGRR